LAYDAEPLSKHARLPANVAELSAKHAELFACFEKVST
jgi:hypothetical protein